jgi:hypothetical protein
VSDVSVRLRYGTLGHKAGDVIEVDKDAAARLVADGNAVPVKAKASAPVVVSKD